ncbi:glucoside xylosyltransferase 2 [Striga asiatica]|uniref:Glucoside xylosyltransferase 2 n=1 Tax=Striga asiatica TaxID=4170 RepID=A0A5A7QAV6_STRAF|nr:glucoside xylosyltransferase 2 [Striga asiatica]
MEHSSGMRCARRGSPGVGATRGALPGCEDRKARVMVKEGDGLQGGKRKNLNLSRSSIIKPRRPFPPGEKLPIAVNDRSSSTTRSTSPGCCLSQAIAAAFFIRNITLRRVVSRHRKPPRFDQAPPESSRCPSAPPRSFFGVPSEPEQPPSPCSR